MRTFAEVMYRFRLPALAVVLFMTIFFSQSMSTQMDNSIRNWFTAEDPEYRVYDESCGTFDGGRFLIVALKAPDVFTPKILGYIKRVSDELRDVGEVKKIHSLANANKLVPTEDGVENMPILSDFDPAMDPGDPAIERIRMLAMSDNFFRNYLLSPDGRYTAIIVSFENMNVPRMDATMPQVMAILDRGFPKGIERFITGDIRLMTGYNEFTKQNQRVFPLIIISMITIFLVILFRSASRLAAIVALIGMSLVWSLGFYGLLGFTYNVVTGMMVPLVIILSIADCIHIIEYFDEARGRADEKAGVPAADVSEIAGPGGIVPEASEKDLRREAFIETLDYITLPCLLTSLTTAFGLASLYVSPVDAVKSFGVGAGAGVIFAFVISIVVIPALMTVLPTPASKRRASGTGGPAHGHGFWDRLLSRIADFNSRRFKAIIVGAVACYVVFGAGIWKVTVETNQIEWFPKDGDFYKASREIDAHFTGTGAMEVLLNGPEGSLKMPDILARMDRLGAVVESMPKIRKVISLASYVKEINQALKDGAAEEFKIPDNANLITQELFFFSMSTKGREELDRVVTPDYAAGRLMIKMVSTTSSVAVKIADDIRKAAEAEFDGSGVTVRITGISYMYGLIYKYLLISQIESFGLAFALVMAMMFVIYRSAGYGILSIVANLLPIVFIVGLMGWTGISINVGTVMVASVALGIALDDTIHFLSRFRVEFRRPGREGLEEAIRETTTHAGKAMVFTTLINIAGFMVLIVSQFQPTREFGLLVSLTLAFALLGDLIVLPACVKAMGRFLKPLPVSGLNGGDRRDTKGTRILA